MYIGTIHAWCLDIMQDTCPEYQKFDVLDEVKQALFVNRAFKRNGMLDHGKPAGSISRHIKPVREDRMPLVSEFYDIRIYLYWDDHSPASHGNIARIDPLR